MQPSVVLASMPWAPVTEPSLALGILKSQLKQAGIACRVVHANLGLLRHITYETYTSIAEYWGLDEFVFTECLSPGVDDRQIAALVERCFEHLRSGARQSRYATVPALCEMLLRFRGEIAPAYMEECAAEILRDRPTMVGFSCMFDQNLASVAVAKTIKERSPDTLIVLGGYALQGPPGEEILKAFPWIDGIARGDGEAMISKLAYASVGAGRLEEIDGLLVRGFPPRPQKNVSLEASPDPDYQDWFADVAALERLSEIKITTGTLPVESSRGCWWGQHKHCVFCGIDDDTLKFRNKSPDKVLAMLGDMRTTYGDHEFRFSDYILPQPYFAKLLPRLADARPKYKLKCEIKANQTYPRMQALAAAGFHEVQPGIESFSTHVLKAMDKGVSGIQNVALLKYGYVEGVIVHYNFLYGLPGEEPEDYQWMLRSLPRLYHLIPPVSRTEAIITRFAPLQADPARFGWDVTLRHHPCYDVLFSDATLAETGFSLDDYGYYFEQYLQFGEEMDRLHGQVVAQINHWKKQHREKKVYLAFERRNGSLLFGDTRFDDQRNIELSGPESAVYLACNAAPTTMASVIEELSARDCAESDVRLAIERLDEERLIWLEDNQLLGLGIARELVDQRMRSDWPAQWVSIYR